MYIPAHFAEHRPEALYALMQRYPLGTLVTHSTAGLTANHIPFLFDEAAGPHGTLIGHVARANSVWRDLQDQSVLVIFHGPNAYISPNWYPSKKDHGKVVPTWNYAVIHAHGVASTVEDKAVLHSIVDRLTQTHERNSEHPWSIHDAPNDYIDKMLDAIVGVQVAITRLEGKFKLGQNRSLADRQGIASALTNHESIATLTRAHSPEV
jgi:transcriptional regulator